MQSLRDELPEPAGEVDLPTVAYYFELVHGRQRLLELVARAVRGGAPNAIHRAIAALRPRQILTTNFDRLTEQALRDEGLDVAVAWDDANLPFVHGTPHVLAKVHGDAASPTSMVISSPDFELYEVKRPAMTRYLGSSLQTRTVLFLGYSASDPNFRMLLARIRSELGGVARNLYAATFEPTALQRRELEARGITCIDLHTDRAHDRTLVTARWLDTLRDALVAADADEPPQTETIRGKRERTRRLVAEVKRFASDETRSSRVIRMRQGFSALSLGDEEYPDDGEYTDLLRAERDALYGALDAGCEIRLVVSRRPLFSSDLKTFTQRDSALARRLRARCRRLAEVLEELAQQPQPRRILVGYSDAANFAEIALGDDVLLRGARYDSASGYDLTSLVRTSSEVRAYCSDFDAAFSSLTGHDVRESIDSEAIRSMAVAVLTPLHAACQQLDAWIREAPDADRL